MKARRRIWVVAALGALAAMAVGLVNSGAVGGSNDPITNQAIVGLKIAPLPLNLRGKNRTLVGLGSYIVNAQGGCNDCHSTSQYAPGGNPYMGQPKQIDTAAYLRGGQAFGPFVSRNLRPEIGSGLPAGRTYAQFLAIMRSGIDFDNAHPQISHLLQVMPWPSYQSMTDLDLRAIYAYLSALPPVSVND